MTMNRMRVMTSALILLLPITLEAQASSVLRTRPRLEVTPESTTAKHKTVAVVAPPRVVTRVDTVRVNKVDTVRVTKTDTISKVRRDTVVLLKRDTIVRLDSLVLVRATPATVSVGTGTVKVDGLLQAQFNGGSDATSTFRIRRAELKLSGQLDKKVKWTVMLDPAKTLAVNTSTDTVGGRKVLTSTGVSQPSRMMQDAFITVQTSRGTLNVGQMKVPLGLEGPLSSAKLPVVERALFMSDKKRGGGIADVRDLGASLSFAPAIGLTMTLGAFNGLGESMNGTDADDAKVAVLRATALLAGLEAVHLGVSVGKNIDAHVKHGRLGVDASYELHAWAIRAEFMRADEGTRQSGGGYLHLSHRVGALEPLIRFDTWDPDLRANDANLATARGKDLIVGSNWNVTPTLLFQLNAVRRTIGSGAAQFVFLTNLQTSW